MENVGRDTGTFIADRIEEIDGFYVAVTGAALRQLDNFSNARRNEDAFPRAVIAHTEGPLDLSVDIRSDDVPFAQTGFNLCVLLFEQCEQHMFGTDVIVIVVAALLLGGAKNAARCRAEMREQTCGACEVKVVGAAGFEPVASASRTQRSTKLSYAPMINARIAL